MSITDTISELTARLAGIGESLAGLPARRRPHALGAATGNGQARKAIRDLDREEETLRREKATAELAVEEAEEQARREAEERAEEEKHQRTVDALKIANKIEDCDTEIDAAAEAMAEALERRKTFIGELRRLGVPVTTTNALNHRHRVTTAFHAQGLHRFADIARIPPAHHRTLAEADLALLSGIGEEAPDDVRAARKAKGAEREQRRQAEVAEAVRQSDLEVARHQLQDMRRRGTARDIWAAEQRIAKLEAGAAEAA